MSIKLYMDVHVRRAVTIGLRLRDVDVQQHKRMAQGNLMTHCCLTEQQNWVVFFSRKTTTYLKQQRSDKKPEKDLQALFTRTS